MLLKQQKNKFKVNNKLQNVGLSRKTGQEFSRYGLGLGVNIRRF